MTMEATVVSSRRTSGSRADRRDRDRTLGIDRLTAAYVATRSAYETLVYAAFSGPSTTVLMTRLESMTGHAVALTDDEGRVLDSSPSYDRGPHLEPPVEAPTLRPVVVDGSLVGASIAAPDRHYLWFIGHAAEDLESSALLTIGLELAVLLTHFVIATIPSTWRDSSRLADRMVRGDDEERIRDHAAQVGHALDRIHHVVAIAPPTWMTAPRLAVTIGPRVHPFGLITVLDDRMIVVVGGANPLEGLLDMLRTIADVGPIRVGVGSPAPNGLDLRDSYEHALRATDVEHSGNEPGIVRHSDRTSISLLAYRAGSCDIESIIVRELGPLLDYDRIHRSELVHTLREWLDATDSLDAVARRLHIHKGTLVYRIRRIKELLGDDLNDGSKRFEVSLALRLLDAASAASESESIRA